MVKVQDVFLDNNIKVVSTAAVVKKFQMAIILLWLHWHVLRLKVVVETAQASHLWVAMVLKCSGAELLVGRLIHTCCSESFV